jgi:hypothetical protein
MVVVEEEKASNLPGHPCASHSQYALFFPREIPYNRFSSNNSLVNAMLQCPRCSADSLRQGDGFNRTLGIIVKHARSARIGEHTHLVGLFLSTMIARTVEF